VGELPVHQNKTVPTETRLLHLLLHSIPYISGGAAEVVFRQEETQSTMEGMSIEDAAEVAAQNQALVKKGQTSIETYLHKLIVILFTSCPVIRKKTTHMVEKHLEVKKREKKAAYAVTVIAHRARYKVTQTQESKDKSKELRKLRDQRKRLVRLAENNINQLMETGESGRKRKNAPDSESEDDSDEDDGEYDE
jgi:hypothetical protein